MKATGIQLSAEAAQEVILSSAGLIHTDSDNDDEGDGGEGEGEGDDSGCSEGDQRKVAKMGREIGNEEEEDEEVVIDIFSDLPFLDYDGDVDESSDEEGAPGSGTGVGGGKEGEIGTRVGTGGGKGDRKSVV